MAASPAAANMAFAAARAAVVGDRGEAGLGSEHRLAIERPQIEALVEFERPPLEDVPPAPVAEVEVATEPEPEIELARVPLA